MKASNLIKQVKKEKAEEYYISWINVDGDIQKAHEEILALGYEPYAGFTDMYTDIKKSDRESIYPQMTYKKRA